MEWIWTQFFFFVFYSLIGWICETVFCSIANKKFINRGFLNGPFCPVYGVGAVIILNLPQRYQDDWVILFLFSVVATSIVEYITSFLLEKIFHLTLWDYSDKKWNINGRICLRNSVLFGILSLLLVYIIHPGIRHFFDLWPPVLRMVCGSVLCLYFVLDVIITARSLFWIHREAESRQMELDELKKIRADYREVLRQKREKAKYKITHSRLIQAFPNMKSKQYMEALNEMKSEIVHRYQKAVNRKK